MDMLGELAEEDRRLVLAHASRRRFDRREVVFHEGDIADAVHLIVKGTVAVRVTTQLGRAVLIDVLGVGDSVGELALIPPTARRAATAMALESTETMTLAADSFHRLRRQFPVVTDLLVGILAQRHRALLARLAEALYVPADDRVLHRLLELAAFYRRPGRSNVVLPLSQEDVADLAGTTRETVNRVLGREAERGRLSLGRSRITVVDPAWLADIQQRVAHPVIIAASSSR